MLNLPQRLAILFADKAVEEKLLKAQFGSIRNSVSDRLKTLIGESAAINTEGLNEGDIVLTSLQKELGISKTIDLLQIDKPIVVRLILSPLVDNNYKLTLGLWLTERQASYTVEHLVVNSVVENVQESRVHKRVERMLGELHRYAAPVIAG